MIPGQSFRQQVQKEGRQAFQNYKEAGAFRCPYPIARSGEGDGRRVWWWEGFLEARTRARFPRLFEEQGVTDPQRTES